MELSQKRLEIELLYDLAILLLSKYLKKEKTIESKIL